MENKREYKSGTFSLNMIKEVFDDLFHLQEVNELKRLVRNEGAASFFTPWELKTILTGTDEEVYNFIKQRDKEL